MATLSMFFGIIISMYCELGGKHNKPHLHARYQDFKVAVALDGETLEGSLPRKQMKLLEAWMVIHEDEPLANWELLSEGREFFKIEPLK